jgi:hypothetical protein
MLVRPVEHFALGVVAREIADHCGFGRVSSQLFD